MRFVVDRFEGDFAILEDENGRFLTILKKHLPDCQESDILIVENIHTLIHPQKDDANAVTVAREETDAQKKSNQKRLRNLFQ